MALERRAICTNLPQLPREPREHARCLRAGAARSPPRPLRPRASNQALGRARFQRHLRTRRRFPGRSPMVRQPHPRDANPNHGEGSALAPAVRIHPVATAHNSNSKRKLARLHDCYATPCTEGLTCHRRSEFGWLDDLRQRCLSRPHCAACGHHHTGRCTATTHHPVTDGASKCGCDQQTSHGRLRD